MKWKLVTRCVIWWLVLFTALSPDLGRALRAQDQAPLSPVPEREQLWYGSMNTDAREFRFLITTKKSSDKGTLQSLDEGALNFELTDVSFGDDLFRFRLPASKASYSGELSDDGKLVIGKWTQAGKDVDLELSQVDKPPHEELNAYWTGTLDAILQKLDIAFRERKDGVILFDSLTQKSGGFIATKKVEGQKVAFDVPAIQGTFIGELNVDGTEIVGKWKQGLLPLSLTLTKAQPVESEYKKLSRPQTPQPPFPYKTEEVSIENAEARVKLAGSLTLPPAEEKVPAVILISGSGPQDRDERIFDHQPFFVIADALTRLGFAVMRWDDRGVGKSTGNFAFSTTADFASDTAAVVAFLRQHELIDAGKIVLCGHSEGGLIAPMVAAKDSKIAGLILLAGPGVNGEQILIGQAQAIMRASGLKEEQITRQVRIQRLMTELAKQEPPLEKTEFTAEATDALKELLPEDELTSEQTAQLIESSRVQLSSPWFRYFMTYEPATALTKIRCPTLVLIGELDLQVEPKSNVSAIESAFKEGGLVDYETHILADLNHLFQTAKTGNVNEYGEIEETFSPGALKLMVEWLNRKYKEIQ